VAASFFTHVLQLALDWFHALAVAASCLGKSHCLWLWNVNPRTSREASHKWAVALVGYPSADVYQPSRVQALNDLVRVPLGAVAALYQLLTVGTRMLLQIG